MPLNRRILMVVAIVLLVGGGFYVFFRRTTPTGTPNDTSQSSFLNLGGSRTNTGSSNTSFLGRLLGGTRSVPGGTTTGTSSTSGVQGRGALEITATMPNAIVLFDGNIQPRVSPVLLSNVPAGTHRVVVTHPQAAASWEADVVVLADTTLRIEAKLEE
ncbi:MAG: hypothetical protein HY459_04515 [Parcubacteria group bacterium]|nr:hypothetical protein [Parcubacteria group bacterium]